MSRKRFLAPLLNSQPMGFHSASQLIQEPLMGKFIASSFVGADTIEFGNLEKKF